MTEKMRYGKTQLLREEEKMLQFLHYPYINILHE